MLFRFLQAWTTDNQSHQIVQQAWKQETSQFLWSYKLDTSLRNTTRALQRWNRESFGYAHLKIKELEKELEITQQQDQPSAKQDEIRMQLEVQRNRMESIYRQKSRDVWLKQGDKNSKFFHLSLLIKRRHNIIEMIKDGQNWITNAKEISSYFVTKFEELYSTSLPSCPNDLEELGEMCITLEKNSEFKKILNSAEIKEAI